MSTKIDITVTHQERAYKSGQRLARLEIERASETPQETLWDDISDVEVFQNATGFKPQEAEPWQFDLITESFENGYYDTYLDEGMGD